jgi:hypothetical protein
MGLSINRGPTWEEDSFGYINSEVSEMNILQNLQDNMEDLDPKIIELVSDHFWELL